MWTAAFIFFGFLGTVILFLLIIYKIADCYLKGNCTSKPKNDDYDDTVDIESDDWAEAGEQTTLLVTTLEQTTVSSAQFEKSKDDALQQSNLRPPSESDKSRKTSLDKPARPPNPIAGMVAQAERMAELNAAYSTPDLQSNSAPSDRTQSDAAQTKRGRKSNNPILGMRNKAKSLSQLSEADTGEENIKEGSLKGSSVGGSVARLNLDSRLHSEARLIVELEFKAGKVLFGTIKSVTNLKSLIDVQTRDICFHMKFNPSKKHRVVTKWKYVDDAMQSVTFSTKATQSELDKNRLLIRVYGRKNAFDRGRCFGQILVLLSKVKDKRKIWTKTIMPRATPVDLEVDDEIFFGPVENATPNFPPATESDEGEPAGDEPFSDVESEPPPVTIQPAAQPAYVPPAFQPVAVQPVSQPVHALPAYKPIVEDYDTGAPTEECAPDKDEFNGEEILAKGV